MPHDKDKFPVEDKTAKCKCGKRALWYVIVNSPRIPNDGKFKDRKVGPYCNKCVTREFTNN